MQNIVYILEQLVNKQKKPLNQPFLLVRKGNRIKHVNNLYVIVDMKGCKNSDIIIDTTLNVSTRGRSFFLIF